ncbi:MAG: PA0069 family radical SAM protein [Pseudomonadota bacterium]
MRTNREHNARSIKGRGAPSNATGRFESRQRVEFDDGWSVEEDRSKPLTEVFIDSSRGVLTFNQSPDIPFDRSVNPYRGCEHGCIYCFARPTHSYLGLSPGLDFETRLYQKPEAAHLLEKAIRKSGYQCLPIALGVNTDAYQPVERKLKITRSILKVLQKFNHPVSLVTKSALIERDMDILVPMAKKGLVSVSVSITTLDGRLARNMEPRAVAPHRRLTTIKTLTDAGIPTSVSVAPVIPVLTDPELDHILESAKNHGAQSASYILLRLPLEVNDLFQQWLEEHYPLKADHVMTRVRDTRGGKIYNSEFGNRMTGSGEFAGMIAQRFALTCKKLGLAKRELSLNCELFAAPIESGEQLALL